MENIKVKKDELLKILRENRTKHRTIFEEALEGYRKTAIAELTKRLKAAESGKKFNVYISMHEPQDQTKDYDRAIGMLEMSVEDFVLLDEASYAQYVMDDWSWKHNFLVSNSAYSGTATAMLAQSS